MRNGLRSDFVMTAGRIDFLHTEFQTKVFANSKRFSKRNLLAIDAHLRVILQTRSAEGGSPGPSINSNKR
jgi:hypothetical protein